MKTITWFFRSQNPPFAFVGPTLSASPLNTHNVRSRLVGKDGLPFAAQLFEPLRFARCPFELSCSIAAISASMLGRGSERAN